MAPAPPPVRPSDRRLLCTIIAITAIGGLRLAAALPNGAPTSVCQTMLPSHSGIPERSTASPFAVQTDRHAVHAAQTVRVRIVAQPPELMFGGFMLHAVADGGGVDAAPPQVVGHFADLDAAQVKAIQCGVEADSTVTHSDTRAKGSGLEFVWQAPADWQGAVKFVATVAQQYDVFWVGVESPAVQVVAVGEPLPEEGAGAVTARPTVGPTTPPFVRPEQEQQIAADPIYDGCGDTKECVGAPANCVAARRCDSIGTLSRRGDTFVYELRTWLTSAAYVALGLSTDDRMGNDAVVECVPEQGQVRAYQSWTTGAPNYAAKRDGVDQSSFQLQTASYVNGSIYCRFERPSEFSVLGNRFTLAAQKYKLLLATGSSLKPAGVGYHDLNRIASGEPRVLLLRLHAAFMLAAWIGTASAGILLARYFKQTWVGSLMCGKDQWFAWHRVCMVLTWLLTLAGFVLIFVELGAWSGEQNPHAILGTVTTVLCFIQPFGAMLRPAPTHRNRPLFNWGHWLVGNLAHILAIVTIFFAVKLRKAELPDWFDWILVGFVAFHVGMHIILSIYLWIQIAGCASDRVQTQRLNTMQMSDIAPSRNGSAKERKMDAPHSGLRKCLLAIYLVVLVLFVVALIVIATLAPIQQTFSDVRTKLMQ